MEWWHWVLLVIGVLVALGILNNLRNPPRAIEWSEVPAELRAVMESSIPGFAVAAVKFLPVSHKYKVGGTYRGREARVDIECNSQGELYELEYEDADFGTVLERTECQLTDIDLEAIDHLGELMGSERESFKVTRIKRGTYREEPAFEIRGHSENWRWEIEITAKGQLIELEKTGQWKKGS